MNIIIAGLVISGFFFLVYWLGRDITPREGG